MNEACPMKLQMLSGEEKCVALLAGKMRPGLVMQLFKGLEVHPFKKMDFVPPTKGRHRAGPLRPILKRLGVILPTRLNTLLPLLTIVTKFSLLTDR